MTDAEAVARWGPGFDRLYRETRGRVAAALVLIRRLYPDRTDADHRASVRQAIGTFGFPSEHRAEAFQSFVDHIVAELLPDSPRSES
jgi:hypothetical protein